MKMEEANFCLAESVVEGGGVRRLHGFGVYYLLGDALDIQELYHAAL